MKEKWQQSLEALDLKGLILVIGILSERALRLMSEEVEKEEKIVKPKSKLIV